MKVKFCCNSGANIHSCRDEIIDLEKDLGISDNEWRKMDEDQRFGIINEWAQERLEIYYVELD